MSFVRTPPGGRWHRHEPKSPAHPPKVLTQRGVHFAPADRARPCARAGRCPAHSTASRAGAIAGCRYRPVGLDYWIRPGRHAGLGSSLSDHFGRLPARALSARPPDGAGPAPGVQGRRTSVRCRRSSAAPRTASSGRQAPTKLWLVSRHVGHREIRSLARPFGWSYGSGCAPRISGEWTASRQRAAWQPRVIMRMGSTAGYGRPGRPRAGHLRGLASGADCRQMNSRSMTSAPRRSSGTITDRHRNPGQQTVESVVTMSASGTMSTD